jgi:hypothetical protein
VHEPPQGADRVVPPRQPPDREEGRHLLRPGRRRAAAGRLVRQRPTRGRGRAAEAEARDRRYKFNKPHGIKITSLRIDGPPGSTILIFCAKKCGKQGRFSVRGKAALFRRPIQKLQFGKRAQVDGPFRGAEPKKADNAPLYSAAKQVFKGRKIKNGNTLFVAVVAPDQIGEIFFWKIKKNAAGPKQLGCIEPNSSRVKAIGRCNGS